MEVHAADEAMPVSCGWHPWWSRHAGRGEPLHIDLDADAMYQRDEEGIQTGELVPVGPHPWDDCFTGLGDRPAVLRWPGALTVRLETSCRCVVVFDEPQRAICVEPQTDPPDAFNLGPTIVRPGEPLVATATWAWQAEAESGARMQSGSGISDDELAAINAYWRAANYLTVGQIYLQDNALLREPLRPEHIKPRLLGHWGTSPGLSLLYIHLNRIIRE